MNMLDPQAIGLNDQHFGTLRDSLIVDPNADKTPY